MYKRRDSVNITTANMKKTTIYLMTFDRQKWTMFAYRSSQGHFVYSFR